jgi:hypothetical protein
MGLTHGLPDQFHTCIARSSAVEGQSPATSGGTGGAGYQAISKTSIARSIKVQSSAYDITLLDNNLSAGEQYGEGSGDRVAFHSIPAGDDPYQLDQNR